MKQDTISLNRKEEICSALKQLMKRKSIQKITIQELVDECGISRYTFYYHFSDIYDCLSWMLQEEIRRHVQATGSSSNWEDAFDAFFESLQENKAVYKHVLSGPNPDLMRDFFHQEITAMVRLHLSRLAESKHRQLTESYLSFLSDFISSALVGILFMWYQRNSDGSEELLRAYLHTILNGQFDGIMKLAEEKGFCTAAEPTAHPRQHLHSDSWNHLL